MNPELMAAIFGMAIILAAIFINILQKRNESKKNRQTATPHLIIEHEEKSGQPIKITLQNIGAGVAYIDWVEIILDGLPIPVEEKDTMKNILSRLGLNGYDILCFLQAKDETIQPGHRFVLIEANPINEREHSEVLAAINRLSFKVRYSSLNGDKFVVN